MLYPHLFLSPGFVSLSTVWLSNKGRISLKKNNWWLNLQKQVLKVNTPEWSFRELDTLFHDTAPCIPKVVHFTLVYTEKSLWHFGAHSTCWLESFTDWEGWLLHIWWNEKNSLKVSLWPLIFTWSFKVFLTLFPLLLYSCFFCNGCV